MMLETTINRTNPLIDPHLQIWHAEIPLYLFLGGLVAGLMILSGLRALRTPAARWSRALTLLPWAGPLFISVGMFFLWLDLEHPLNAWRFYLTFEISSPMSWGAWILVLVYPCSLLLALAVTRDEIGERWFGRLPLGSTIRGIGVWARGKTRSLAVWNIVVGAGLGVYTGVLLGTMAARPLWNSAVLGPLFLVSGLSTGAAFLLLFRLSGEEQHHLSKLDMGFIAVELVLIGLWLAGLATGGAASRGAAAMFFGGPYTAAFWTLVVALGLLTPLIAEFFEHRHGAVTGKMSAVLVLVGGFALRWIIVSAGQYTGWITDLAQK